MAKYYGVTHPTIIRTLRKFEAPISALRAGVFRLGR
jgi:hypothetical protein